MGGRGLTMMARHLRGQARKQRQQRASLLQITLVRQWPSPNLPCKDSTPCFHSMPVNPSLQDHIGGPGLQVLFCNPLRQASHNLKNLPINVS